MEEGDLEGLMAKEDACFREFQRRTRHEPDQVLRFVDVEERRQQPRGVQPLWVCESGQLGEAPPPPCDLCGEPRVLEFQVLPQLLHFLEVERQPGLADVDWGTIVVYTCRASCSLQRQDEGEGGRKLWAEEFAFVQNMHASGSPKEEGGEGSSSR